MSLNQLLQHVPGVSTELTNDLEEALTTVERPTIMV
jgi:hypothetical protein